MTHEEISTFVETLADHGDVWTPDQVLDVYGTYALPDAIKDRLSALAKLSDTIMNAAAH
ncbi:MAG: hypothetical protein Q4C65_02655 [Eubacteriales bacterium]|nr:hypothetical protein [Eubacteriales bacterium]